MDHAVILNQFILLLLNKLMEKWILAHDSLKLTRRTKKLKYKGLAIYNYDPLACRA